MPAIISDQFRILNAANFVAGVADTSQYYYSFIGLPNSQDIGAGYGQTDWNTNTPAPMDGFKEYNDAWDTMLGLKQLSSCLLYTSPSPRDRLLSRMPSSA